MMMIAPISNTGWRGPAKPAEYGTPVDWTPEELTSGTYAEFAVIDEAGQETIERILPINVDSGTTLCITMQPPWYCDA